MEQFKLDIYNIVGSEYCIESGDGEHVFSVINRALDSGKQVLLSFNNIDIVTTAFLNPAIGRLLEKHAKSEIYSRIIFSDISESDMIKVERVIETAELYYKDPDRMQRSVDSVYED